MVITEYKHITTLITIVLSVGFISSLCSRVYAERIQVFVEDAAPLVDEQGHPLGIKILQAVEDISDLRFEFTRSTYSRALLSLKERRADIILHVPYQAEPGFDEYGIYLEWTVPVKADLYALNSDIFKDISQVGDKQIGIPRGNIQFASKVLGIPQEKFYEVNTMSALVKMFAAKRIGLIWFDRVSVHQELRNQNIQNVHYYEIPKFGKQGSVGIGLQSTERGLRLKKILDSLLTKVDTTSILAPYYKYLKLDLPQAGIINKVSNAK
jgi:polar amino acid transport system substrate-binding protein